MTFFIYKCLSLIYLTNKHWFISRRGVDAMTIFKEKLTLEAPHVSFWPLLERVDWCPSLFSLRIGDLNVVSLWHLVGDSGSPGTIPLVPVRSFWGAYRCSLPLVEDWSNIDSLFLEFLKDDNRWLILNKSPPWISPSVTWVLCDFDSSSICCLGVIEQGAYFDFHLSLIINYSILNQILFKYKCVILEASRIKI